MCQCINTMKHSPATTVPAPTGSVPRREPITVLSGLPGPVRAGVVLVIAVIVGVASLCQVGVLAPQFQSNGGGSAGPGVPGGVPPGAPPGWTFPTSPLSGFVVLKNTSVRAWEVTAVDVPRQSGVDVVAFPRPPGPADNWVSEILSRAAPMPASPLPVTVPRGGDLAVFTTKRPGACALPGSLQSKPSTTRARVHFSSPLGDRSIDVSIANEPAPPCPT